MKTSIIKQIIELALGFVLISSTTLLSIWLIPSELVKKESMSEKNSFSNLCASRDRFQIDPECAMNPVAPILDTKWKNKMNITANEEAKKFFNQGLFFLYGFNHAEAERAFKEGIRLDPDCAMCYWGASLSLGPNINVPMPVTQIEDAYKYSRLAAGISENVSPKEKAIIAALQFRYQENPPEDRADLDMAYAKEMKIVSNRYREDLDLLTLYGESLMDLMPWNYWEDDLSPKPETREILSIFDYILEQETEHPGANHYYIHLTEAVHPKLALPSARMLTKKAYPSGHLVHMPSHIYIRVGQYLEASNSNIDAIALDENYIETCKAQGVYPAIYYPHNIHFLWFSLTMEGRRDEALSAAKKLNAKTPVGMISQVPFIEMFKTMTLFTQLRFGLWDDILLEKRPHDELLYSQAIWNYAKGMAYAKKGNLTNAQQSLNQLQAIQSNEVLQALDNPQFPTIGITNICEHLLQAEIFALESNTAKKLEQLNYALDAQNGLIYMEPPFFYYTISQSIGDALNQEGKGAEAEQVFLKDLDKFPNNGWALKGLQNSLQLQGRFTEANQIKQQFEKAWSKSDIALEKAVF